MDNPITIQDAHYLMEVLDKDIPECDKRQVALLLLILSADHKLADKGEVVGYSPRTYYNCQRAVDDEYYGCYGC